MKNKMNTFLKLLIISVFTTLASMAGLFAFAVPTNEVEASLSNYIYVVPQPEITYEGNGREIDITEVDSDGSETLSEGDSFTDGVYTYTFINDGWNVQLSSTYKTHEGEFIAPANYSHIIVNTTYRKYVYPVNSMDNMFSNMNYSKIDVSSLDLRYVTTSKCWFENASNLYYLDLSMFDINEEIIYDSAFAGCTALYESYAANMFDVTFLNFTSNKAENVHFILKEENRQMISYTSNTAFWATSVRTSITEIEILDYVPSYALYTGDIIRWDVGTLQNGSVLAWLDPSNKTKLYIGSAGDVIAPVNSNNLFSNFPALVSFKHNSNFDTAQTETMVHFLSKNISLTSVDVTRLVQENATDISNFFSESTALSMIDGLDTWEVDNVINMSATFMSTQISSFYPKTWNTSKLQNMDSLLENCTSMEEIDFSEVDLSAILSSANAFKNNSSIYEWAGSRAAADMLNATKNKADNIWFRVKPLDGMLIHHEEGVYIWTDEYRTAITEIEVLETLPETVPNDAFDLSGLKNGSVLAWKESNKLFVAGNGTSLKGNYDMSYFFSNFTKVTMITGLENIDMTYSYDWSYMFYQNSALVEAQGTYAWAPIALENIESMFELNSVNSIIKIDLSSLDTSYINMSDYAFCVSRYSTAYQLSNLSAAFARSQTDADFLNASRNYKGAVLFEAKIQGPNLINPYSAGQMFWADAIRTTITEIEVLNAIPSLIEAETIWDLSDKQNGEVVAWMEDTKLYIAANGSITAPANMSYFFSNFTKVTMITGLENIDMTYATTWAYMFYQNSALVEAQGTYAWAPIALENISHMFELGFNAKIVKIDLSSLDTASISSSEYAFCIVWSSTAYQLTNLSVAFARSQTDADFLNSTKNYKGATLFYPKIQGPNSINPYSAGQMFWADAIRTTITEIEVLNAIPSLIEAETIWDLSDKQNGEVVAWMEDTKLYIAANGSITAPANMSYFFSNFTKVTMITGLENIDMTYATTWAYMFYQTPLITETRGTYAWNPLALASIEGMYFANSNNGNAKITIIDLMSLNTSTITSANNAFRNYKYSADTGLTYLTSAIARTQEDADFLNASGNYKAAVQFKAYIPKYSIIFDSSILSSLAEAEEGTEITLTSVNPDMIIMSFYVNGDMVLGDSFIMPDCEVYITNVVLEEKTIDTTGYTMIEYIQSSGTQYIDTLYTPNENTVIELTMSDLSSTNGQGLVGATTTWNVKRYMLYYHNGLTWAYNGGVSVPTDITAYQTIKMFNGNVWVDNNQVITDSTIMTSGIDRTLTLFLAGGKYASYKLYSFSISEGNTTIMQLVPAIRDEDSVVGLFDMETGTFFTNSGIGEFGIPVSSTSYSISNESSDSLITEVETSFDREPLLEEDLISGEEATQPTESSQNLENPAEEELENPDNSSLEENEKIEENQSNTEEQLEPAQPADSLEIVSEEDFTEQVSDEEELSSDYSIIEEEDESHPTQFSDTNEEPDPEDSPVEPPVIEEPMNSEEVIEEVVVEEFQTGIPPEL